jgi:hypothetical protein
MPNIRVIAGAAVGCLFVCGLFGGQGMAQTTSADPVSKLIQLLHPDKSETKPPERSAAKHPASKAHSAAKKSVTSKPAPKENTSNETPEVTPNELVIDSEAIKVASPNEANEIDLSANAEGVRATDAPSAGATTASAETIALAVQSNSGEAVVSQTPSSGIGSMSWLLRVIAALSGAVLTGSLAWFLIGPSASADVWVTLSES